jgi:HAMP domain-containing protein
MTPMPMRTETTGAPTPRTWRTKLLLLLLAFAVVPVLAQATWDYLAMRRAFQATNLDSLQGLARAKAQAIDQMITDRRTQVERIAGIIAPRVAAVDSLRLRHTTAEPLLPTLKDAEALPVSGPPAEPAAGAPPAAAGTVAGAAGAALRPVREYLQLILWDQRHFEELLVMDLQGRVVASTFEAHEGHDASALEYFRQGRGTTYVQPVFLSPVTNRLTMIVSTPIRDPGQGVLGVLAARLNLGRFFEIVTEHTGLGESGETLLGKLDKERILFMAPTRHDPGAALQRSVAVGGELGKPLQRAVRGQSGAGRAVDYREREILAGWEPVPSLDSGIVVKIDRAEAMEPAVRAGMRMLALLLPLVIAVGVVSWLAARSLVRPLLELRAATERISRGDFDVQLDITSRDEIGQLADSFDRMIAAIKFFRHHSRPLDEEEEEGEDLDAGMG